MLIIEWFKISDPLITKYFQQLLAIKIKMRLSLDHKPF